MSQGFLLISKDSSTGHSKWKKMEDFLLSVLFNSISVVSGRWADDNEKLCAMEPCLQLTRFYSGLLDQ